MNRIAPDTYTPQQPSPAQSQHLMQGVADDEINLLELADKLLNQWRWWAGGAILGGAMGLGAAFFLPPK